MVCAHSRGEVLGPLGTRLRLSGGGAPVEILDEMVIHGPVAECVRGDRVVVVAP